MKWVFVWAPSITSHLTVHLFICCIVPLAGHITETVDHHCLQVGPKCHHPICPGGTQYDAEHHIHTCMVYHPTILYVFSYIFLWLHKPTLMLQLCNKPSKVTLMAFQKIHKTVNATWRLSLLAISCLYTQACTKQLWALIYINNFTYAFTKIH